MQAAGIAWRKQAALAWHEQHGAAPPDEQQRHLPVLLQQLQDAAGIAEMQQQLEPEQRQPQQHDVVIGTATAAATAAQPSPAAAAVAAASPLQPQQPVAAAADAARPVKAAQDVALPALQVGSARSSAPAAQPGSMVQAPALAHTAHASSLVAQVERLQAAAASLAAGGSSAGGSGGSAATAAALGEIQRQLRELQQLALPVQPQPSAAHAVPHALPWPAPEQLAAAVQRPGSPACSQLLGGGFDGGRPAARSRQIPHSWADPLAGLQPPGSFPPAGRRWPEATAPARPPGVDVGNGSSGPCLVRLPGSPSLTGARAILAATLRRAVPPYERCFESKRAALGGLLRLGLSRSKAAQGSGGAFEQAPVELGDLADELQQVRGWCIVGKL